jgi:ribosome biogenesis protein SSF1/2
MEDEIILTTFSDIVNAGMPNRNVAKSPGGEYRNPPLLVLNNFQQPVDGPELPQLRLMSTMFQGLFPPIQVEKSALPTFRRVMLVSYNHSTGYISIRHFTISVRPQGVSRRVRKLLNPSGTTRRGVNLANQDDIADYLVRRVGTPSDGYDSMSESEASEAESDSNAVELPDDYVGRGNKKGERKAVKLLETGPRLELKLMKIVEGLVGSKRGEGQTVFHAIESRSKTQSASQQRKHDARRKLRDERKAVQAANVARKKAEKAAKSKKGKKAADGDDDDEDNSDDEVDVDGLSDVDSDVDPEEALERRRARAAAKKAEAEEDSDSDDEFDYEDGIGEDVDDWDMDAEAGDVPSASEDSDSEDDAPPPKKRPGKR